MRDAPDWTLIESVRNVLAVWCFRIELKKESSFRLHPPKEDGTKALVSLRNMLRDVCMFAAIRTCFAQIREVMAAI